MNADWLLTIGTILEEGTFQGVKGPEISFSKEVIQSIIQTAVNKPIHLFHRNREENIRNVGRIYAAVVENGKGKIKYITWNEVANEGINSGDYKLSMESKVFTGSADGKLGATGGIVNGVALVETPAVPGAHNESVAAVALEEGEEVENAANADPGIRFPKSAQLNEKQLSPCISLLQKHGYNLSKEATNMSQEISDENQEEQEIEQEIPDNQPQTTPAPEPTPEPAEEVKPDISTAEFEAMQAKMKEMEAQLSTQSERMATLEGTDLKSIKDKILKVAPKTDFKILLAGVEEVEFQKKILSGYLTGLMSRDTPDVNLEGVDAENEAEKPDPVEMEKQYFESYLKMTPHWLEEKGDE